MASRSTPLPDDIFAAGAVLWQKSQGVNGEISVALVHRPKYDDWSFPKGKIDPGETAVVAAVREVEEETGFAARFGRYLSKVTYPVPGHRRMKKVDYWAAEAYDGKFEPNDEVDELRWVSPTEASEELSYPMDRKILRRFLEKPPNTDTVLLVRHGRAGRRSRYKGDDTLRPLDKVGQSQADALVAQLLAFGADRVHSADRRRCVQTVQPLADRLGEEIILEPLLSEEGYWEDPAGARERARAIASAGGVRAICSQGKVIPDLLQSWADEDGVKLPPNRNRKGSVWVLSLHGGRLIAADHLASPLPVVPAVD
ncbi:NUDIX hydrolase [Rhodococcus sp. PAMC28707]|uniref:NUDIX hydrolase n=1 Tax=unclassified Rhodococcus (in: high G+C Gram-positive bacteria) TaxID=192944 RepID=UPI00109E1CD1|nr:MULTISPECIES: bifunctional NUDIX hydrolase/histidine phosphatase family protein [unclassified Rhodococcus (in: high G+C Gram-positive bacteria)]QCB50797.1 NUDIX hydrolase [Rhodococcus sp. PAMC28705]QCB57511.1 NUDIX hydrolase [Rhodococcus sp. PAMC28707]